MTVRDDKIAIIGMAGRFAGAGEVSTFWHNVLAKVDAVREASDRWSGPFLDPGSSDNDRIYTRKGGFLGDQVEFDPSAHGVMPSTVGAGDADHFLALQVTTEALADADYLRRPFDRRNTGIILGHGTYVNRGYDTLLQHGRVVDQTLDLIRQLQPSIDASSVATLRQALKATLPPFDAATIPALVPNIIAGRIANRLDLQGPNFIVDAACASSLVAIEMAAAELSRGRYSMMLAGGVHSSTPPQLYMMFCLLQALSRHDIRPFDEAADGTLLGEGLGVVVLKRLQDARAAGDRIYAVIAGSGTSSDGRALGLLTPRQEGQELALRRAYEDARIDPDSIGLVEAHGTGTPVGDATELRSLQGVFGARGGAPTRALGSVKSMIGHCISAAGVAGLIKTALALHDKVLPPTLCGKVNESLDCRSTSFYINTETRPWIHGAMRSPRRAGINAFGFGGVNAHVILEEFSDAGTPEVAVCERWPSELLVFSADDAVGLAATLRQAQTLVDASHGASLASIAHALTGRSHGSERLAMICRDVPHLSVTLTSALAMLTDTSAARARPPADIYRCNGNASALGRVALLFPGEGSQYPNMLSELCLCFGSVRRWFDLMDDVFAESDDILPSHVLFPPPSCWTQAEREEANARLFRFDLGSAAVFCASMALHELLDAFGVRADVLVGHSTGEGAALVAGGAMHYETRAQLLAGMRTFYSQCGELERSGRIPEGQLLTVGAIDPSTLASILDMSAGRALVALDNSVNQCVLYCDAQAVSTVITSIQERGGVCAKLPFQRAYHTPLFEQLRTTICALYDELNLQAPERTVYSCATAHPFPGSASQARELAARQWFSPVRFRETMLRLHEEGVRTFIEVGPGATLSAFVRDTLGRGKALTLSSNHPRRSALFQLQSVLAELFVRGMDLNFAKLYDGRRIRPLGAFEGASPAPRAMLRLDLTMPQLRLDDSALAVLRNKPASDAANQPTTHQIADAVRKEAAEPTPSATPGLHTDLRLAVLRDHFKTMGAFLATQKSIFVRAGAHGSMSGEAPHDASTGFEKRWPLLGRQIERTSTRLRCERVFDVDRDTFLQDHTLGICVSARVSSMPLPVLPLTVSMEMLAQAAHCLAGGDLEVVRIDAVKAHRWLALDEGTLRVQTRAEWTAQSADGGAVRVNVYQISDDRSSPETLVFEGIVHLAGSFAQRRELPQLPDLHERQSSHYAPNMLYASGGMPDWRYAPMFHGPCFQGVRSIQAWDATGIDATFTIRVTDGFFSDLTPVQFLTDPVMLDSAGQLIGYWVAERFGVDLTFFPFQVRRYEQYGRPLAAGEHVHCRARIRLTSETPGQTPAFEFVTSRGVIRIPADAEAVPARPQSFAACRLAPADAALEAEFEFIDARARVIARLSGWRDRYFSIPHAHYRCHLFPSGAYLSEPWLQAQTGLRLRRCRAEPYLEAGGQIWKRALAHLMLTRDERRQWYALPDRGERRTQWLLGRVAAKDAVRQWAKDRLDLELAPCDIEIATSPDDRPEVRIHRLADTQRMPAVSISHCAEVAVAAASDPRERSVGIDVDCIGRTRIDDLREVAFVASEQALIDAAAPTRSERVAMHLWCAKEAALKAAPPGARHSPLEWIVSHYSEAQQSLMVANGAREYSVRWFDEGDHVLAVATAEGSAPATRDVADVAEIEGDRYRARRGEPVIATLGAPCN
jgi:acyl transferase domain-containing protein/phosphopantetheinyl transferase